MTNQQYMEGLALQNEKVIMQESMFNMIKDFRNEGFEDEEIYYYMKDIILNLMHGKTYQAIEDILKKEREQWLNKNK